MVGSAYIRFLLLGWHVQLAVRSALFWHPSRNRQARLWNSLDHFAQIMKQDRLQPKPREAPKQQNGAQTRAPPATGVPPAQAVSLMSAPLQGTSPKARSLLKSSA